MNTCNFFVYRLFVDFICADFFKYDYTTVPLKMGIGL